ncbi:transmembrane protein 184A [Babesia caballi]|uniref:Transmembrane protein 184A n=1 Tax=Babesia caballi TaxID=5871 RepID=A0AAV4LTC3_BABCB|nr:transmembrane protein 184A [Babesia caballi]
MMEYCGGESQCGEVISRDPAVLRHIWPLRSIKAWSLNDDIPLNVGFVKRCRMGTMQYAFVRPILALLSVVFRLMGIEKLLIVAIFNWVVINASVYLALYALGLFYVATKKHPGLQKANCLTKCISLKLMVVFTFYQGCVLSWFTPLERGIADQLNTVLVLLELPIFAVLLQKAYDVEEFIPTKEELADPEAPAAAEPEKAPECQPQCIFDERLLKVCGAVGFNADDIREAGTPAGAEKILNSASKALNMKDLFNDIYHNISGKYREHAVLPQANTEANADEAPKKAPDAKAEAKAEVDFAEFEKEQSKQSLEEKAGTLSKLQFV